MEYCTNCGCPVVGEPLIPDRGMKLCWLCVVAGLEALADHDRLDFIDDYSSGHLERASIERARMEAETLGARKAA